MKTKPTHTPTAIYDCKGNHGFMCSCMQNDLDRAGWSKNGIERIVRAVNSHEQLLMLVKSYHRIAKADPKPEAREVEKILEAAIDQAEGGSRERRAARS